jgi:hypothetical protein
MTTLKPGQIWVGTSPIGKECTLRIDEIVGDLVCCVELQPVAGNSVVVPIDKMRPLHGGYRLLRDAE